MIIFDVDGTLIGGENVDWRCFDEAFEEAAGFPFPPDFFHDLEEVTAQAMVHVALGDAEHTTKRTIEAQAREGCRLRLEQAIQANPEVFPPMDGAHALWQDLRDREHPFGIATGDWHETISLKLIAAGFSVRDLPMATSSDRYTRAEIIAHTVEQAGNKKEECVYVGDGVWDLRATRALGIPFIGCGVNRDVLRAHGAQHVIDDLSPESFWSAYAEATAAR